MKVYWCLTSERICVLERKRSVQRNTSRTTLTRRQRVVGHNKKPPKHLLLVALSSTPAATPGPKLPLPLDPTPTPDEPPPAPSPPVYLATKAANPLAGFLIKSTERSISTHPETSPPIFLYSSLARSLCRVMMETRRFARASFSA